MSISKQLFVLSLSIMAITAPSVFADVFEFQVAKVRVYEQDSSSVPTTELAYIFDSYIDTEAGDASSATVNGTSLPEESPGEWAVGVEFASQAALDAAFPAFVYNMHIQGGSLGVRDETVTLSSPAEYPAAAALTPESFNATQGANPSQDLLIEWVTPDASTNVIYLTIYDVANDIDIFDADLPVSETGFLIDASLLSHNQEYEVDIAFGNVDQFAGNSSPGFGVAADGLTGYASVTVMSFTTAEQCDDVGRFAVVKGADYTQDSENTQPATADSYFFGSFIDSMPGEIEQAWVLSDTTPLVELFDGENTGRWEEDDPKLEFESKIGLDSVFPTPQTFEMHASGGFLGSRIQEVTIGEDNYPAAPYLPGTGFSDLQSFETTDEITIEWAPADPAVSAIFVNFFGGDEDSISEEFDSSATSITIPADMLTDGTEYELLISFVNSPMITGDDCPGFGTGSEGVGGFVSSTAIFFTPKNTPDCIADFTGDGILNFFDVSVFLIAFSGNDPIADFTNDGVWNFFDIAEFLAAFAAGCA